MHLINNFFLLLFLSQGICTTPLYGQDKFVRRKKGNTFSMKRGIEIKSKKDKLRTQGLSDFEIKMRRKKDIAAVHISEKWRKGHALIYDCDNLHFACVDDVSWGDCKIYREEAKKDGKYFLPCAPLREMESERECIDVYYKLMFKTVNKSFCYNSKEILLRK